MTSDSSITVKLIYKNYDKEKQIKKKVIMNVQLKTFSSILLFRVVKNSPFWTKGCLTSNQGCLQ